VHGWTAAAVRR